MKKIFVAGHTGMVGSAICRQLQKEPDIVVITRARDELDLCNQFEVQEFMKSEKPDEVILAAAKVGGIYANETYPAEFIYENLQIQNNVIHFSHVSDVQKLLFLGSSCIYPKQVQQPMREDALLSGLLEPTNEPYAIAKIAGIKMCESYNRQYARDYRSVMPCNLFGPGDNYHPDNSHVIPALIRRLHEAKEANLDCVTVWGSGTPMREFLYVDDMAEACLHVHNLESKVLSSHVKHDCSHVNIGAGKEISIFDLAYAIKDVVNFKGEIKFDRSKPDGSPRKLMSSELLVELGWQSKRSFKRSLLQTYENFKFNYE